MNIKLKKIHNLLILKNVLIFNGYTFIYNAINVVILRHLKDPTIYIYIFLQISDYLQLIE